jgi:hypothetical protein
MPRGANQADEKRAMRISGSFIGSEAQFAEIILVSIAGFKPTAFVAVSF